MTSKKKKSIPVRPFISGAIVIAFCSYFIVICVSGLDKEYVEHGWQQATGTVLDPEKKLSGKKNTDRLNEGYEQTINYAYAIEDRRLESNSVSPELFVNKEEYPEGKIVDVWYNPENISESVLVRRKTQKQYLWGFILFCSGVVVFTIFNVIRDVKNAS